MGYTTPVPNSFLGVDLGVNTNVLLSPSHYTFTTRKHGGTPRAVRNWYQFTCAFLALETDAVVDRSRCSLTFPFALFLCGSFSVAIPVYTRSLIGTLHYTYCYDEIKETQDLNVYSHADSPILSHCN